jgi:hypothetical protein
MKDIASKTKYPKLRIQEEFIITHPLFDILEEKINVDKAGPLKLTFAAKWSLILLRFYLIVMVLLSIFRILQLGHILK